MTSIHSNILTKRFIETGLLFRKNCKAEAKKVTSDRTKGEAPTRQGADPDPILEIPPDPEPAPVRRKKNRIRIRRLKNNPDLDWTN